MEEPNLSVVVLMAEKKPYRCSAALPWDITPITVAGEAIGMAASKRLLKLTEPDVAIVVMKGSIARCLRFVRGLMRACSAPILVISSRDDCLYAERVLSAGARGYVTGDASPEVLVSAIRAVNQGYVYLSDRAKKKLLNAFREADWNAGADT